ncbi:MAG: MarR family transcriptional regulator [Alphaproteobacteria bacterium]|nr:MarR family transcriptional regulator [Alphaproteobacteria bacterium]
MPTIHDFERAFGFVLYEAARLYGKRFDHKARALGLSRAQCHVLFRLAVNEGANQARLAELLELEPISLARMIDRMEEAGWVERRADPADRRARLLYLTSKAKPIFDRIVALGAETRGEALTGISPADRDRMIELLTQVRRNLSERGTLEPEHSNAGERA